MWLRSAIEFLGRHPFATGLFALIGVAGFLFSIYTFYIEQQQVVTSSRQLTIVERQIGEIAASTTAPSDARPKFSGNWSEQQAYNVAWPTGRYDPSDFPTAHHSMIESDIPKLERSFFIPLGGEDVRILITSLSEGTCNACAVQLSLFLFRKNADHWLLDQSAINFTRVGQKGQFFGDDLDALEVWTIGDDRFGFVVPLESWHQGNSSVGYSVFAFVASEMTQVFDGITRSYFSGLDESEARANGMWEESEFAFEFDRASANFGFYDLVGNYRDEETEYPARIRLRFDGEKYPYPGLKLIEECARATTPALQSPRCRDIRSRP